MLNPFKRKQNEIPKPATHTQAEEVPRVTPLPHQYERYGFDRVAEYIDADRLSARYARKDRKSYPSGTRPATIVEYETWLKGYLNNGGKITHYYDYSFERVNYRLACMDVELEPLCGARAYTLILLPGVKWTAPNGRGHITVCELDGFKTTDPNVVTAYKDMRLI